MTVSEATKEASDKLNDALKADERPEAPKPVKAPKEAKVKALARGEYEIEVPHAPYKKYADGETPKMVTKRFFKPKNWTIAASARNARWLHVIDLDRVEDTHEALCTVTIATWMGGRKEYDVKTTPITCPWCWVRVEKCGLRTPAKNEELRVAYEAAKKAPKKDKVEVKPDPKPSSAPKKGGSRPKKEATPAAA